MPALPDGEPAPEDGALPAWVHGTSAEGFGLYLHVPFCRVRCGYCDFNTYTAGELGGGASQDSYARTALREIDLAARVLDAAGRSRPVGTVFVGGGTPTLLPVEDLALLLDAVRTTWGLEPGAEVTTEANPDSVTVASLAALAEAGFTRVSFGMQSAVPHVLATLERTHDPERVPEVVRWAREAGLAVSLDLIYGTPGESVADWQRSVEAALACGVDHVSAYALVVEEGTRMGGQVRRGLLPAPDPDDQATKYELADALLTAAGLGWYEVSNWARTPEQACRHNLALLARGGLVGHRSGRALPRRRGRAGRALVERQAPARLRRAARRRAEPRCRARTARRGRRGPGTGPAAGAPARGPAGRCALARRQARGRRPGRRRAPRRPGCRARDGRAHPARAAARRRRGAGADRLTGAPPPVGGAPAARERPATLG